MPCASLYCIEALLVIDARCQLIYLWATNGHCKLPPTPLIIHTWLGNLHNSKSNMCLLLLLNTRDLSTCAITISYHTQQIPCLVDTSTSLLRATTQHYNWFIYLHVHMHVIYNRLALCNASIILLHLCLNIFMTHPWSSSAPLWTTTHFLVSSGYLSYLTTIVHLWWYIHELACICK